MIWGCITDPSGFDSGAVWEACTVFARRLIGSAPSRIRWLKFPKIGDPNIVPEIVGSLL